MINISGVFPTSFTDAGGSITITGTFPDASSPFEVYYYDSELNSTLIDGAAIAVDETSIVVTIPPGLADGTYSIGVGAEPPEDNFFILYDAFTVSSGGGGGGGGGGACLVDQQIIIRDRNIRGAVVLADSEDLPIVGLTVSTANNVGALAPTVIGSPTDSTIADIEMQITQGGAIGSAGWAWKDAVSNEWFGANGETYAWGHHCPTTARHQGAVVVYSSMFRRVLVISAKHSVGGDATGVIQVSWQSLNDRPQAGSEWESGGNSTTLTPSGGASSGTHALAACEVKGGAILLFVRKPSISASNDAVSVGDWDVYRSEDGGSTWALARTDIQQAAGSSGAAADGCARVASSGDWVRFAFVEQLSGSIASIVSADGGATWQALTALVAGSDIAAPLADRAVDIRPFDIVAVDDHTGAFLLVTDPNASGATNRMRFWYASRDGEWTGISAANTTSIPDTPRSYVMYRDPYWLWLWIACGDQGSSTDSWVVLRCKREDVLNGSEWIVMSEPDRRRGAMRLSPAQVRAVWCEDRAAVLGYLVDSEGSGARPRAEARPWLHWVGGWSRRPWSNVLERADGLLESVHWDFTQGEPAGGATSSTQTGWVHALNGAGTHSWALDHVLYSTDTTSSFAYSQIEVVVNDQADPPQWDPPTAEAGKYAISRIAAYEWVCAMGNTSSSLANNVGVRVWTPSTSGSGAAFRLAFRMGTTNVNVYDENGAAVLATLAAGLTTLSVDAWHRFRFVVAPVATAAGFPQAILMHRPEGGDTWTDTGVFALPAAAGAGVTMHRLAHGILNNSVGGPTTVGFREFRASSYWFQPDYTDWTAPGSLPGARASGRPRGLTAGATGNPEGLRVYWGGAGGIVGDRWTHSVEHEYAADRIAADSPQLEWRSVSGATAGTGIVYDACHGGADDGRRWVHSHIAMYGLGGRRTLVEWANDLAISSGVVALTLDGLQHSGLRAASVSGSAIRIDPLSEPADPWREGELAGRLLVVTAGSSSAGHVHRVAQHLFDGVSHHVVLATGGQFAPGLITAGATMSIVSDRVWGAIGETVVKRYMRVSFGLAGDNNWDGRWRCGAVVPGVARSFDPHLSWSHTDEEEPNTVENRSRNGQSWAYEEGPAARVWVGRQVGDTTGNREGLRDLLRVLAKYQEEPIALLLNDEATEDQDRRLLYVRWEGGTRLDQQAWHRPRGTGTAHRSAGDQQVQFREIV